MCNPSTKLNLLNETAMDNCIQHCEKWIAKKPLPNLPPQSVIVLDSAPFHCLLIAPLSYAGKAYTVSWLCKE
jgi:hypothetical protein